jgi:hypothetical protein
MSGSPALKSFYEEVQTILTAAGCSDLTEWAEKQPGKHLSATYGKYPSCALCGAVEPRDGYKSQCNGIARIELRNQVRDGQSIEMLQRACEAARMGVDTVVVLARDSNRGFERLLSLLGSMKRENNVTESDRVTYLDGAITIRFKDGGILYLTDSQQRGSKWSKSRTRTSGRQPEMIASSSV